MIFSNPHARRSPYDADLQSVMDMARSHESRLWLSHWTQLNPGATPLWQLPQLARQLRLAQIGDRKSVV